MHFHCKALPDGGRLLTYGNVSELVRRPTRSGRLAAIDGLTGLNNRRNFCCSPRRNGRASARYGRPLSLLMIDIDMFKAVNDKYGHDAGDEVLKAVADLLQKRKRAPTLPGDWAEKSSPSSCLKPA